MLRVMVVYFCYRLWLRNEIQELKGALRRIIETFTMRGSREIDIIMPGYTHLQVSPSFFDIFFQDSCWRLYNELWMLILELNFCIIVARFYFATSPPRDREVSRL